jgi:hypothetical protein
MNTEKEYDSKLHGFLRPESFCAEMIKNGFSFDLIKLISDSNFKKSFRNEIEDISFAYNEHTRLTEMELLVNRDGIYDRLPEGIFHQTRGNSKTNTTREMTEEFRRFREEEKLARKFFQPIEQEIFRYATLVEQEELNLAFGILKGTQQSDLSRFWGLPDDLPGECLEKLVQVMPWAAFIKGNISLTAKALEIILNKPVAYEIFSKSEQKAPGGGINTGKSELGIDTVLGNHFSEPAACWKFFISGLKKSEIALYRPGSTYGKFLKQYEEIFIPLPIDIIFEYTVLSTDDDETEEILGYSLML